MGKSEKDTKKKFDLSIKFEREDANVFEKMLIKLSPKYAKLARKDWERRRAIEANRKK